MLELGQWRDARAMLDRALLNDPENVDLLRIRKQLLYLRVQRCASRVFRPLTLLARNIRR
jgi:hypothetical protein